MVIVLTHIARVRGNRARLPILLVVSEQGKTSLSLFAPESLVSRDGFGSPVPRQPVRLHTLAESGAYLRDSFGFPRRRPFIYIDDRLGITYHVRSYQVDQSEGREKKKANRLIDLMSRAEEMRGKHTRWLWKTETWWHRVSRV